MLTTRYVTGSPNWLDLAAPDMEAAQRFYEGIFDWTFQSAGPEAGGYGMFQSENRTVAGAMTVPPEQGPPSWTVYFQTPDAEATAKAVQAGGGSVAVEPMDVFDMGRMAVFTDPAGVGFAAWQPGTNKGLDVVNEDGALFWLELYAPDTDSALTFYRSVFGWETTSLPMPGDAGNYLMINPSGQGADAMFGGIVPVDLDPAEAAEGPYWAPYFHVADVDATVAKAEQLGGTVRMAPVDLEGVGRIAKLADPFGARFAIMKSSPTQ
ncbi:VOC family protein [Streptomyces purpureus]|uniref:VOC family protein n=1 Tax=Streptomyces purpureus TaxID=1951 RepID=UPI0037B1E447